MVSEAIEFFNETPAHELPPPTRFIGTGVYALYYIGNLDLYFKIAELNREDLTQPIYVGKAVPRGWRTARSQETDEPALYRRLREHFRSIRDANNLDVEDFFCRFMLLGNIESDLVVPVEAELIRRYTPLWNSVIDGFGNHDPGSGRYNQAKSEWDILHPGRVWAERLRGDSPNLQEVIAKINSVQ
jgi:hypothetical protein